MMRSTVSPKLRLGLAPSTDAPHHRGLCIIRQGGEDTEKQPAIGGGGVNLGAGTGQDLQADAARCEGVDQSDQMLQVPAKSVELPDNKGIAGLERLQAGGETGAVVVPAGGKVFIDAVGLDAGGK